MLWALGGIHEATAAGNKLRVFENRFRILNSPHAESNYQLGEINSNTTKAPAA
jgi:hypothetical protein